jgi:hypothetical protein
VSAKRPLPIFDARRAWDRRGQRRLRREVDDLDLDRAGCAALAVTTTRSAGGGASGSVAIAIDGSSTLP